MAVELLEAGKKAVNDGWVQGVLDLDNSRLFQIAPGVGVNVGAGAALGAALGAFISVLLIVPGILWLATHANENRAVAAQIDVFGALVYRGMVRSMDPQLPVEYLVRDNR